MSTKTHAIVLSAQGTCVQVHSGNTSSVIEMLAIITRNFHTDRCHQVSIIVIQHILVIDPEQTLQFICMACNGDKQDGLRKNIAWIAPVQVPGPHEHKSITVTTKSVSRTNPSLSYQHAADDKTRRTKQQQRNSFIINLTTSYQCNINHGTIPNPDTDLLEGLEPDSVIFSQEPPLNVYGNIINISFY
ncbi:hypothetical protein K492DRAFT_195345 [Lichtheimia hyalospora FSU 10163]|nr:hypothetical protein K492DRAFT_195345 [Lichtheimia hyalospora FSU 10163]